MGQNSSRPKHTSKYNPKSGEVIENADAKGIASKLSKKTASPDVKILAPNPFDVRAACPQFRILVIGKANAGKTTLLKKVCDSVDDPEIFSPSGEKIDPKVVEASHRRGEHDITNQLVFKSNPGYIFHDSRGFESGSVDEIKRVKNFIAERAATKKLSDQLHAIWYCLPTDTNRPVTKADEDFFNTGVRGQVPLIAIFTKVDGLEDSAFAQLQNTGYNIDEAMEKLAQKTQEMLTTDFRQRLEQTDYPPSEYLQLEDMREADTSCKELIEKTAANISDGALRMLFVSVQRNNIGLSVRYAVTKA
ncbi:GTP-binding protein [Mycena olivaceomarginata]|nr:GTP-binding protein [Mycena olivaceomarginata]